MINQAQGKIEYRPDIDGLRAIAVSSVIVFHAFPKFLTGGFLGVDVFFVISGFLIASIVLRELAAGTFKVSGFYQKRIRRIFPALIVVLAACLGMGLLALFDVESVQLSHHAFYGAFGLANLSLYGDTGYFSLDAEINPLLHLWSLGVEEQFYLLIPLLLLIFGESRKHLLIAFATVFAGSLWLSIDPFSRADATSKFYLPQYRTWELMAGVLLAYVGQTSNVPGGVSFRVAFSNFASLTGLSLLLFAFLYFDNQSQQWLSNGTVVLGTILLIAAGPQSRINKHVLSLSPAVSLGLISYPLYLWHWPILVFGRLLMPRQKALMIIGLILFAVILAYLTWKFVEKPIRSRRWQRRPTLSLIVAMACVAGLAGFIYARGGRVGWASETSPLAFESTQERVISTRERLNMLIPPLTWSARINALFLPPYKNKGNGDEKCIDRYWGDDPHENVLTLCSDPSPTVDASVAVIGDSHSYHLYEGLKDYYKRKGQDVLALAVSACPLFPEPPGSSECSQAYDRIFARIASMKSIHTVILSEYVPYMSYNNRPNWVAEARKRLVELTHQGKKVVLMVDIPSLGINPRQYCYPRSPFHWSGNIAKRCGIIRWKYNERVGEYRGKAAEVVKNLPNVMLFNLADRLCNEKMCPAIVDGQVIYRDENHLNYYGSLYMSQFYDWDQTH